MTSLVQFDFQRPLSFATRAEAIANLARIARLPDGTVFYAGGYAYRVQAGATSISGMPNVVPNGEAFPQHYNVAGSLRVPTHFPTLQAVFDTFGPSKTRSIKIIINAGHALTAGLRLVGGDYSMYEVVSEDAKVTLASGFTPVVSDEFTGDEGTPNRLWVVNGVRAKMPLWSVLVDIGALGLQEVNGLGIIDGSEAIVNSGFGFNNGYQNGQVRAGSKIIAQGTNWSDAQREALQITSGSFGEIRDSTFDNAMKAGTNNTNAALAVSRGSTVHGQGVRVRNSGASAIEVARSYGSFSQAIIENYNTLAISGAKAIKKFRGGTVIANLATVNGAPIEQKDVDGAFNIPDYGGVIYGGPEEFYGLGRSSPMALADANSLPAFRGWRSGSGSSGANYPSGGSRYWPIFDLQRDGGGGNENDVRFFFENGKMFVRWYESVAGVYTPVTKEVQFV